MKYLETHPWINFQLNLTSLPFTCWMMLGEAQSKCLHIAGVPLMPGFAKSLNAIFLAKGILATTAIEGNTLSEEEVMKHLEGKLNLPKSKQYLQQEIDNIILACNEITEKIDSDRKYELTVDSIKHFNKLVLKNLESGQDVKPGEIRQHSVTVGNYRGAPAADCEYLLEKLCQWLNDESYWNIGEGNEIAVSMIKAIVAHIYIAWIHPFGDGNGRTARIIELLILLNSGVPMPASQLLSNHYNETRTKYYRYLDETSKRSYDLTNFIMYATEGLVDGLKGQLDKIKNYQWKITWDYLVHMIFKDDQSKAQIRRRNLLLDLSKQNEPVKLSQISGLSVELYKAYSDKSERVIRMDMNELIKKKLVRKTKDGYWAQKDIILAFLPLSAMDKSNIIPGG